MSTTKDSLVFVCSFCEQSLKISPQHIGRCTDCPKCGRKVLIIPNRETNIEKYLSFTWHYRRSRFLLRSEEIGPLTDEQFVEAVRVGSIQSNTEVNSPQATKGEWVLAKHVVVSVVQDRIEQRRAEQQRYQRKEEHRRAREAQNMQTLYRAVATAISDGRVTLGEREQLIQFARSANIPQHTVEELLREQSDRLIQSVISEALEDGFLEPREKQRISELAAGLGVPIRLSDDQSRQLYACELAWQLANGMFSPGVVSATDVSLVANEVPMARTCAEWFEIVQQKKPTGIRLDEDHSLKPMGSGDCLLTNKRITLVGQFAAKKATLSSVAQIRRFRDGVFCNRATGKSIFLRAKKCDSNWDQFAILLEHSVTKQPVLGIEPQDKFISDETAVVELPGATFSAMTFSSPSETEPRYTFRVVGDHVGDRAYWINGLRVGDPVQIVREPSNMHDHNAVAVYDTYQRQLGYLKREVAKWFGPMLDRGCRFRSQAFRKPTSGGLIVAMYE